MEQNSKLVNNEEKMHKALHLSKEIYFNFQVQPVNRSEKYMHKYVRINCNNI